LPASRTVFTTAWGRSTSTFYQHWKTDIQLLKQLNHNSFRTSISWARLIPDGIGEVNPDAVDFYNQVIDELNEQGITPFITLFHFDMPMAMQEIGGWENRDVVDAYARYAQICFELFGDRVLHWFTFNEPIVPVEGGYLYDFHYPNVVDFAGRPPWRITPCWPMRRRFRPTAPGTTRGDRHRAEPDAVVSARRTRQT
jgi:beta-glucosidase/6-phospho-beta-glucosidase/beta-galactosidase